MKKLKRFAPDIIKRHRECLLNLVVGRLDKELSVRSFVCPVQRHYLNRIQRFLIAEDGLVATPEVLKKLVNEVEDVYFRYEEDLPRLFEPVNELLAKVFDYEYFRDLTHVKNDKWGGVPLMREILSRVKYCPYCNAETVYAVERKESPNEPIKCAFDHFYPKGRYPFLALSLYNLIPSCYRCNSQYKRDQFRRILEMPHPYMDDIDDLARFVPLGIQETWFSGDESDALQLVLRSRRQKNERRISDYDNVFDVSNIYSQLFKREAVDALVKAKMFSPAYVSQLSEMFKGAGLEHVNIKRLLFGTTLKHDNIDKERLSKLVIDMKETVS